MSRLVVCLMLLGACQLAGEPGNGKAARETRKVTAFSAVAIDGSLKGDIAIGPIASVEVTGDENLLPLLATVVESDTLRVHTTKSVRPKLELAVHVVVPALSSVKLVGSGDVHAQVAGDKLAIGLDGSGSVTVSGAVRTLAVEMEGSGVVHATDLVADAARVSLTGSGTAEVTVGKQLDVNLTGSGSVVYHGHPQVKQSVTGSGSVEGR